MRVAALAAFLAAAALAAPLAGAIDVDPSEIIPVLPKDAIPAITDPRFDADDAWLAQSWTDRVVAVEVNGDARAYPLAILNWHEIVDDVVGGRPIAVTYCPLCGTGIAFDRTVRGAVLEFRVSGKLYKNDLVMYDTATESYWSQLIGTAIMGTYKDTVLSVVTASTILWPEWKSIHPSSSLLARPQTAEGSYVRDYFRNPYGGYDTSSEVYFPQGNVDANRTLFAKEFVLGIVRNGEAVAFPFRFLDAERLIQDTAGGDPIVVTFSRGVARAFLRAGHTFRAVNDTVMADEAGDAYDMLSGASGTAPALEEIQGTWGFWFAWFDFHPDTRVYKIGTVTARRVNPQSPWIWIAAAAGVAGLATAGLAVRRRHVAARLAGRRHVPHRGPLSGARPKVK